MPVSKPEVVDAINVDRATNAVVMLMVEERDWDDWKAMLLDLEKKLNTYITFVFGGQINENPHYRSKPVIFELHCQYIPPKDTQPIFRAIENHLATQKIGFRLFVGHDRTSPLTL